MSMAYVAWSCHITRWYPHHPNLFIRSPIDLAHAHQIGEATGPTASTTRRFTSRSHMQAHNSPKKSGLLVLSYFFISSCYLQRFFRTGVHHHATFKLHHCKKQDKIRRRGRTGIGKSPNCAIFGVGLTLGHGPWVCSNQLLSIHVDTTNHLMGMSISHSTLFRY